MVGGESGEGEEREILICSGFHGKHIVLICLHKNRLVEYLLLFMQHSPVYSKCRMCHSAICCNCYSGIAICFSTNTHIYPEMSRFEEFPCGWKKNMEFLLFVLCG